LEAAALSDTTEVPICNAVLTRITYASTENIREIERFAVNAALEELRGRYPNAQIRELPRNNPGFDVEITSSEGLTYVEIKGTERSSVQFFVTEGELQFSRAHPTQYKLIVVYKIDREEGTYSIYCHDGPIVVGTDFRLQPIQWVCEVIGAPPLIPVPPSMTP